MIKQTLKSAWRSCNRLCGAYPANLWRYIKQPGRRGDHKFCSTVYFDIHSDGFKRYAYTLIAFFSLCEWQVLVRHRYRWLRSKGPYSTLWLTLPNVRLAFSAPRKADLSFSYGGRTPPGCICLSPDYFTRNPSPSSFHVPMAMAPLFYNSELWNAPVRFTGVRNGIFFAGDFDKSRYAKPLLPDSFACLTRLHMSRVVREKIPEECRFPRTWQELENCYGSNRIVYVDKDDFEVPRERWRETLASFNFFLAHPGTDMPLCHNIVEAISVGCIPILQEGYAKVLHASLKSGVNCLIFRDEADLCAKLREGLSWPLPQLRAARENVARLYNSAFTPQAVASELLANRKTLQTVYLLPNTV
jgi:hypothetical protein